MYLIKIPLGYVSGIRNRLVTVTPDRSKARTFRTEGGARKWIEKNSHYMYSGIGSARIELKEWVSPVRTGP